MINFKILFTTFILLCCSTYLSAQDILKSSQIYIDTTNSLNINTIKNKTFTQNDKSTLSYGYSPNFTVWVKFTIENNSSQNITKILEYGNSLTTHIEFYDDMQIYQEGLFCISPKRHTIKPTFPIKLKPYETKTFYLKTSSYITTLIVKLNLYEIEEYHKKELIHQMILSSFFAAMLILAFYNFFVYFFTKDKNYLFYILYLFGIIFHQLAYTGFANIYLFSQATAIFVVQNSALVVAIPIFLFALLVRSFLHSTQYKIWDKILRYYLYIFPFITALFLLTDAFNSYRNTSSVLLLLLLLSFTVYSTYKRNRQAYFVLFGWFLFAIASIFMYLSSVGVVDIFTDFPYFVEITLVLEAIVFSLALADKIKQLQENENIANMRLILNKSIENTRLERQVEIKTQELKNALEQKELLLKELNHRVKNNMQMILSLIRLQSSKISEQKTKEIFTTIQNRINAMSSLHELLYTQDTTTFVDANDYFELLIEQLQQSYESENITISTNIQTNLKIDDAVYCGLIANELITNSFKYAFKNNKGKITINLSKKDDLYILSIEDDGIGYNQNQQTDSLGHILINTLTKEQLKGELDIKSQNGVKVEIQWK